MHTSWCHVTACFQVGGKFSGPKFACQCSPSKKDADDDPSSYHTFISVTMEKRMMDGNRSCSFGFFDLTAVKWQVMCNHGRCWQGMLAFPWLLNQHLPKPFFLDFAHASLSWHNHRNIKMEKLFRYCCHASVAWAVNIQFPKCRHWPRFCIRMPQAIDGLPSLLRRACQANTRLIHLCSGNNATYLVNFHHFTPCVSALEAVKRYRRCYKPTARTLKTHGGS